MFRDIILQEAKPKKKGSIMNTKTISDKHFNYYLNEAIDTLNDRELIQTIFDLNISEDELDGLIKRLSETQSPKDLEKFVLDMIVSQGECFMNSIAVFALSDIRVIMEKLLQNRVLKSTINTPSWSCPYIDFIIESLQSTVDGDALNSDATKLILTLEFMREFNAILRDY